MMLRHAQTAAAHRSFTRKLEYPKIWNCLDDRSIPGDRDTHATDWAPIAGLRLWILYRRRLHRDYDRSGWQSACRSPR